MDPFLCIVVNGVARDVCGSTGTDNGRTRLDAAESGAPKTSSEHWDRSSLALASTACGCSPLASRLRRSAISFSISAFRLPTSLSDTHAVYSPKGRMTHWNCINPSCANSKLMIYLPSFRNPFEGRFDLAFNLQPPAARTHCSWSLNYVTSKLWILKFPSASHPYKTGK